MKTGVELMALEALLSSPTCEFSRGLFLRQLWQNVLGVTAVGRHLGKKSGSGQEGGW